MQTSEPIQFSLWVRGVNSSPEYVRAVTFDFKFGPPFKNVKKKKSDQ